MKSIACIHAARRWSAPILAVLLIAELAACGGTAPAVSTPVPPAVSAPAPCRPCTTHYSVVTLSPDNNPVSGLRINRRGQVAYTLIENGLYRAKFFTGSRTVDLGTLGGELTISYGLNDAGQVTGVSRIASGANRAFLWTEHGGMTNLGTLGGTPGYESSSGMDINNAGQVVGATSTSAAPNAAHPFLWSTASGMVDLGTVAGSQGGIALAINDNEQVAGDADAGVEAQHSFFWSRSSGMLDLGTLGGTTAITVDINAKGVVMGNSSVADPAGPFFHAFVSNGGASMVDLGTLGGTESNGAAINAAGQVVGIANTAAGPGHAFIWSSAGGMSDLGTLGGTLSRATAINDDGLVVGMAQTADGAEHAFIWSQDQGMRDLNGLVRGAPPELVLSTALAISPRGEIVAVSNAGLVLLRPERSR